MWFEVLRWHKEGNLTKLRTQSLCIVELDFKHCTSTTVEMNSNYSNFLWVLCMQSKQSVKFALKYQVRFEYCSTY